MRCLVDVGVFDDYVRWLGWFPRFSLTAICIGFYCIVKSTSFPSIDHFSTPMSDSKPKGFAALMKMRKQEKKEEAEKVKAHSGEFYRNNEEKVKPVIREASLSCSSCQQRVIQSN